jgi:hypothetical protein
MPDPFRSLLLLFRQVQWPAVEELSSRPANYLGPKTGGHRARQVNDI